MHLKDSAKERIDALAQIFGKQAEADKLKAEIDTSFEAAKAAALGKGKGLVILVNGGKMSAFGTSSRLGGWLHQDIGVPAADSSIKEKATTASPLRSNTLKKPIPTGCLCWTVLPPSARKARRPKTFWTIRWWPKRRLGKRDRWSTCRRKPTLPQAAPRNC